MSKMMGYYGDQSTMSPKTYQVRQHHVFGFAKLSNSGKLHCGQMSHQGAANFLRY